MFFRGASADFRFGSGLREAILCFSIRSVALVEEPSGDKLEERGVRGERRASRASPDWTVADSRFCCKTNGKHKLWNIKGTMLGEHYL